jgi:integrase
LRWSDLDKKLEMLTLTDERSMPGSGRAIRTLNTGRNRTLPVHASLKAVLEKIPRDADGFVFHGPLGGRLKPDTVRNVFIREVIHPLAKRFPYPRGTGFATGRLHSFRHHFASECANQNMPLMVVMHWLGHADSAMVQRYYHLGCVDNN